MTPEQKLKWAILAIVARWANAAPPAVTVDNVDALYDQLVAEDGHWDAKNELRCTGIDSGLRRDVNYMLARNYDYREVAAQMPDGTWVGWTYWHGGGKHGNPEGLHWMEESYAVTHRQEPKTIIVDIFDLPAADKDAVTP